MVHFLTNKPPVNIVILGYIAKIVSESLETVECVENILHTRCIRNIYLTHNLYLEYLIHTIWRTYNVGLFYVVSILIKLETPSLCRQLIGKQ